MAASALTYSEITKDALVEIGILDEGQAASAAQVTVGIKKLNQMLLEGQEAGTVNLGFVAATTSASVVKIPDWAERAVTLDLSLELAAYYHVDVSIAFQRRYDDSREALLARALGDNEANLSYLPGGQAKRRPGGEQAAF